MFDASEIANEAKQKEEVKREEKGKFDPTLRTRREEKPKPGPRKKKNGVRKSFNIDQIIVEKFDKEMEEKRVSGSELIEIILRKHFNMK